MDNNRHKFQTTGKFHLDLDRVKTDALEMGGMVESQLYNAMGLIKKRNDLFATKIIENDIPCECCLPLDSCYAVIIC